MTYRVVFTPEAEEQLADLYNYLADAADPDLAARYVEALVSHCEKLDLNPQRGRRRDDVRPGLRLTHYKKRNVIAFTVDQAARRVAVIGLFHGGRDYETILRLDQD